jgi:nucleotide-binding universal stress UspA family protein
MSPSADNGDPCRHGPAVSVCVAAADRLSIRVTGDRIGMPDDGRRSGLANLTDLRTDYLGLRLRNPLVASASPLSQTVDGIRRLADSGIGAVVVYSLLLGREPGPALGGRRAGCTPTWPPARPSTASPARSSASRTTVSGWATTERSGAARSSPPTCFLAAPGEPEIRPAVTNDLRTGVGRLCPVGRTQESAGWIQERATGPPRHDKGVEMNETGPPRVVVGVNGSLASLQAIRQAVAEARRRGAGLNVVHAEPARASSQASTLANEVDRQTGAALRIVDNWLDEALGGPPAGLPLRMTVTEGMAPGPALVGQVRDQDDLLVIGASSPRRIGVRWAVGVGDYCTRHADCPVLVVPPPQLARELGGRAGLRWWQIERQLAEDLRAT